MPDAISKWKETVIEESEYIWSYIRKQKLDDSFGWGAMTKSLSVRMKQSFLPTKEQANSCGLLLTGPDGCGKHTAAAHMMTHLEQDGYQMIFLSGKDLAAMKIEELWNCLESFFDDWYQNEQSICIQLEAMEDNPCRDELLTYFGQYLRRYTDRESYGKCRLFLILIDNQEKSIPNCLRNRLILCRMHYPDFAQREAFLESHASILKKSLSFAIFTECTEGVSYAQLADMVSAVSWYMDAKELTYMSTEELSLFISGQMPEADTKDERRQFIKSVERFMEELPKALAEQHVYSVNNQAEIRSQVSKTVNEKEFTERREAEIREMPTYELFASMPELERAVMGEPELISQ